MKVWGTLLGLLLIVGCVETPEGITLSQGNGSSGQVNISYEEIDTFITEMEGIAGNLDTTANQISKGNWVESQSSLKRAMTHLFAIDNGIDDLEQRGVAPEQIERGRAGSTYLHKKIEVMEKLIDWNLESEKITNQMNGLEGGTKEDIQNAIDAINTWISDLEDIQNSISELIEYSNNYRSTYPEDAENFEVDKSIQDLERDSKILESRSSQFDNIVPQLESILKISRN